MGILENVIQNTPISSLCMTLTLKEELTNTDRLYFANTSSSQMIFNILKTAAPRKDILVNIIHQTFALIRNQKETVCLVHERFFCLALLVYFDYSPEKIRSADPSHLLTLLD